MSSSKNETAAAGPGLRIVLTEEAIEEAYRKYYGKLLFKVCKMGLDLQEAEDIVGDVFQKVCDREEPLTVDSMDNLWAYFAGSVKWATLNFFRDSKRAELKMEAYSKKEAGKQTFEDAFAYWDNEATTYEATISTIYEAIATLPEHYRRVIEYTIQKEKTDEIALRMGISTSLVYKYRSRALEMLRERLKDDYIIAIGLICLGLCETGYFFRELHTITPHS